MSDSSDNDELFNDDEDEEEDNLELVGDMPPSYIET